MTEDKKYIERLEERNLELQEIIMKLEDENAIVMNGVRKIIEAKLQNKNSFISPTNGGVRVNQVIFFGCDGREILEDLLQKLDDFEQTIDFSQTYKNILDAQKDAIKYKRLYTKTKSELLKVQKSRKFDKFIKRK